MSALRPSERTVALTHDHRCECLLMAQNGHSTGSRECMLLGVILDAVSNLISV